MPARRHHEKWNAGGDDIQSVRSAVDLVLRRLVGSQDPEYEDLMQSSMESVLTTIDRGNFRGDCPTGGWAAVIARNVAVDAIRVRTRERQLFAHEEADGALADTVRNVEVGGDRGPEHLSSVQEGLRRVKSALIGLCPHKANVVFLHDILGHQLDEVATILGISVAAAQSRLMRGRRQIINSVGGQGDARQAGGKTGSQIGSQIGGKIGGKIGGGSPAGKRTGRRA
ncbi:MAG TPA: RNA polymerase sigma factor, partial [Polyangia bacterium]